MNKVEYSVILNAPSEWNKIFSRAFSLTVERDYISLVELMVILKSG